MLTVAAWGGLGSLRSLCIYLGLFHREQLRLPYPEFLHLRALHGQGFADASVTLGLEPDSPAVHHLRSAQAPSGRLLGALN